MKRFAAVTVITLAASGFMLSHASKPTNDYKPRSGDLIFQSEASPQSGVIMFATLSRFNHVGIVFVENGKPYVYEAVGRVVRVPLRKYVNRGIGKKFTVRRLNRDLTSQEIKKLRRETRKYLGKRYDMYVSWSDKRMYCSELAWKVYNRALGVKISSVSRIKDYAHVANAPVMWALKKFAKSNFDLARLDLDEKIVAPGALAKSRALKTVFSN